MTKKILIVEDEETLVELLSEIFSDTGDYEVLQVRDGQEAFKTVRAVHPDVILPDSCQVVYRRTLIGRKLGIWLQTSILPSPSVQSHW